MASDTALISLLFSTQFIWSTLKWELSFSISFFPNLNLSKLHILRFIFMICSFRSQLSIHLSGYLILQLSSMTSLYQNAWKRKVGLHPEANFGHWICHSSLTSHDQAFPALGFHSEFPPSEIRSRETKVQEFYSVHKWLQKWRSKTRPLTSARLFRLS